MEESITKIDIIIIIILALLVSFIIGFNIIQVIDNKLNSVIINVPPQKCMLPPIYLNLDKDRNIIKIYQDNNLDESIQTESIENKVEEESIENFGNLPYNTEKRSNMNRYAQKRSINNNLSDSEKTEKNENYNTINEYPYLIDPDNKDEGYYPNRIKLVSDEQSPLIKLQNENMDKINNMLHILNKKQNINEVYDGYNKYPNLRKDSYANITSIGKSLMTPYVSYPTPS